MLIKTISIIFITVNMLCAALNIHFYIINKLEIGYLLVAALNLSAVIIMTQANSKTYNSIK